jgi:Ca2+/Na+ antiporter
MHPYAFSFGSIIGGAIAVALVAALWRFIVMRRVIADPVKRNVASVAAGWVTASTLAGFGMADGGPYAWHAWGVYLVPAVIVGALAAYGGLVERTKTPVE